MPHAPKTLYERLVRENSSPHGKGNLSQVILLGNDLKSYQKIMVQEEKDKIPVLMELGIWCLIYFFLKKRGSPFSDGFAVIWFSLDPDVINALPPPDLTQLNHDTGVHAFNETCFQWFTKSQHDKGTHQVAA
jgi:hypothetical protein